MTTSSLREYQGGVLRTFEPELETHELEDGARTYVVFGRHYHEDDVPGDVHIHNHYMVERGSAVCSGCMCSVPFEDAMPTGWGLFGDAESFVGWAKAHLAA